MKRTAYTLIFVTIIFIALLCSASDVDEPFFKSALIVFGGLIIIIGLILLSIWLISLTEQKEREDRRLLIEGRKHSFVRAIHRRR